MDIQSLHISINAAIEKGVAYLWSKHKDGHWMGFPTLAGTSDIWVTGFLLTHIHSLSSPTHPIKETQAFLSQSQHASGGWSYSAPVPPDADSTSWCLQALSFNNAIETDKKKAALVFLKNHYTGNGIATYTPDGGIAEFIGVSSQEIVIGWTSAHTDVSLAYLLADPESEQADSILGGIMVNASTGLIDSYWWRSPYYATALYYRLLKRTDDTFGKEINTSLLKTLQESALTTGGYALENEPGIDCFSSALCMEILYYLNPNDFGIHQVSNLRAILQTQNENGGWSGKELLRIPAPYVTNPANVTSWNNKDGGGNSYIPDTDGLFTTALVCYALDLFRQKILE